MGTRGSAGPEGLGCTDLTAHPDTKVEIPEGTTIARIHLTRTLFGTDKQPCTLTNWLHALMEDNPGDPIIRQPQDATAPLGTMHTQVVG